MYTIYYNIDIKLRKGSKEKRDKKMKKYTLIYWLKNQSKEFSEHRVYTTTEEDSYRQAVAIANANGYDIEKIIIEEV